MRCNRCGVCMWWHIRAPPAQQRDARHCVVCSSTSLRAGAPSTGRIAACHMPRTPPHTWLSRSSVLGGMDQRVHSKGAQTPASEERSSGFLCLAVSVSAEWEDAWRLMATRNQQQSGVGPSSHNLLDTTPMSCACRTLPPSRSPCATSWKPSGCCRAPSFRESVGRPSCNVRHSRYMAPSWCCRLGQCSWCAARLLPCCFTPAAGPIWVDNFDQYAVKFCASMQSEGCGERVEHFLLHTSEGCDSAHRGHLCHVPVHERNSPLAM
jgi:hypothetical protein